ncbi:proteoglycan 4-like [Helicoverpa zea]|uniref:proteoglycan 4-like n=1 Tax=Helicoverpa zea TaxID=7113 RepID=UPI001F5ACF1D|nr:proteoglycan 4-like [Helicoverpa zea]
MFLLRTFCSVKMNAVRVWVLAATLQALLLPACCGNHRRSMAGQQQGLASKGGWRPVVGSGGLLYGSFGTAPLHAQHYKIPVPVIDQYQYQSSTRPLATKDGNKLTSIAQSYRPTTLRTVPASAGPAINQPINTYHNPFAFQNGFSNYKYVQNYPVESVLVRNPHNPYNSRPIYSKYTSKLNKNHAQNMMLQQLTNVQPIQFGQYQTNKPLDLFGKPIESYARPTETKKQQTSGTEIYKQELYKLQDSDTAPQSVSQQQVKTAQQQGLVGIPNIANPYPQYSFQDSIFPPSILGSFGTFGVQSVKGRDPVYQLPTTKTTYLPPQPTKQTIFNSFSYSPNYKTTATIFDSTTPRLPTTPNQIHYATTYSDFKITPTPQTKVYIPPKIDPNAGAKDTFKPSPQDPFAKNQQSDFNKVSVTTYNPTVPTTTLADSYYDYNFPAHQNQQGQISHEPQNVNFSYEKKKHKIHDSVAAGGNQQPSKQYVNAPLKSQDSQDAQNTPHRQTYEVTEATESDVHSHSSTAPWTLTSQVYDYNNQKTTEESAKQQDYPDTYRRPEPTPVPDLPEEFAIVTEAENGHDNSLSYDMKVESQSRRPLGDDFVEPIGKHKLKDYYYKVSTPSYDDYSTSRRTKKPTEAAKYTSTQETTTQFNNNKENNGDIQVEALPTLPPNKHFKRPNAPERKRNKVRRRRPPLANINRTREETTSTLSTRSSTYISSTEPTPTTDSDEVYTIRPRVRPTKSQPNLTTPTVTTDLTTSALPTVTPTIPTIVKKKLAHRRPVTTPADRPETTTVFTKEDLNQESQIMKITNRPHFPKLNGYDFKNDFSHKQDEKDTPTSDVAVSLSDTLKTTVASEQEFSFHKDVKPIEAKLEPVKAWETTTEFYKEEGTDYTTTPRLDVTTTGRAQRPRLRNKYNRTRFNVKDYRNRLSSTTSTTEKPAENTPKIRFPQRRVPYNDNNDSENTTERKRFTPKDPRYKNGNGENSESTEKDIHVNKPNRQRQTTEAVEATTIRVSARIRNGQRRPRPTTEEPETTTPTAVHSKRPLRKKIKDSEIGESVQDISVTETTVYDRNEITSERTRSESAIMKIADKKHQDHLEHLFEHSKRVSDLTLAASKDYNKPGMFKTISSSSRRIPNYFTIATDDPILPIEAFFPQLNQKKES